MQASSSATLAAGADLKSSNRYGGAALIPACHYGHVDTVRLLLTTGIDVNHVKTDRISRLSTIRSSIPALATNSAV